MPWMRAFPMLALNAVSGCENQYGRRLSPVQEAHEVQDGDGRYNLPVQLVPYPLLLFLRPGHLVGVEGAIVALLFNENRVNLLGGHDVGRCESRRVVRSEERGEKKSKGKWRTRSFEDPGCGVARGERMDPARLLVL